MFMSPPCRHSCNETWSSVAYTVRRLCVVALSACLTSPEPPDSACLSPLTSTLNTPPQYCKGKGTLRGGWIMPRLARTHTHAHVFMREPLWASFSAIFSRTEVKINFANNGAGAKIPCSISIFFATVFFQSTTSHRPILYFLLHYMCLTDFSYSLLFRLQYFRFFLSSKNYLPPSKIRSS